MAAPGLLGLGAFAWGRRRDALGAGLALLLAFQGVVCALAGFASLAPSPGQAAQLQAYAVLVEVAAVLWLAASAALAAVLRRRQGGSDLLEMAVASPRAAAPLPHPGLESGGAELTPEPEPGEAPADPDEADEGAVAEPRPEAEES